MLQLNFYLLRLKLIVRYKIRNEILIEITILPLFEVIITNFKEEIN
jgi:hypothetical protein